MLRAALLGPEAEDEDDDARHLPAWLLRSLRPSSALSQLLEELPAIEVDEFTAVEVVAAFKRLEAYAAAGAARTAAMLAGKVSMSGTIELPVGRRTVPFAAAELAMRLTITRGEASNLIAVGDAFTGALAETAEALERGEIDLRKATTIVTTLSGYPDAVAWQVQAEVLPKAGQRTHRQLVQDLSRALIGVDSHDAELRHRRASEKRHVTRPRPLPEGQASMTIVGPAQDVVAFDVALQAAATAARAGGDGRTTDQLRFDASAAMAHHALGTGWIGQPPTEGSAFTKSIPRTVTQGGHPDTRTGQTLYPFRLSDRIKINVTVPASLLIPDDNLEPRIADEDLASLVPVDDLEEVGCSLKPAPGRGTHEGDRSSRPPEGRPDTRPPDGHEHSRPPDRPAGPGPSHPPPAPPPPSEAPDLYAALEESTAEVAELGGIGPVTPAVARLFALGGTWRRIVTDPITGVVHDVGRTSYRPPAEMARYVRERDRTCIRPGCSVPAASCQLDHGLAWALGGATASWNLEPLCDPDHDVKTAGGFRIETRLEGVYVWTAPSGHRYVREADGTLVQLAPHSWPDPEEIPF
ncbi:HNH endonuclease signature motif containing protein [Georgenia sp. SUBG003]|uniref:HNH endonuclease signature motif containing protein n=1 Tax=Georgenia sp. SUBG003 TaxID=1497974 RepID=UPI000694C101